jgi:hypothetical protein
MSRLLSLTLVTAFAILATVSPALAQKPQDVVRVERAVLELDRAKRSLGAQVAARRAALERSLRKWKSKGKGWKRIKRVRNGTQRRTYTRSAKFLWKELNRVARERAAYEVYKPIFDRFLAHFAQPLSDPTLEAGVIAHRRRLAFHDQNTKFASCKSFNKVAKRVRGFKTDAEGDIKAGAVNQRLATFVRDSERAALRKWWGSKHDRALQTARQRLKDLGGNGGYADYFAFALALRV